MRPEAGADALAEALAAEVRALGGAGRRRVVAIAGPPASGKSTLAASLVAALNREAPGSAAEMPMDGYHLDNAVLAPLGLLARKGAPETFDADAYAADLARVRAGGAVVHVPVFDRGLDLARAFGRRIEPSVEIVVTEGNYLLLDDPPWAGLRALYDLTVRLDVPEPGLLERLVARWLAHGHDPAAAEARARGNDLVNARLIASRSGPADRVIGVAEG